MPRKSLRPKSPPSSRQLDALANKLVKEIVDATKLGQTDYIAEINDGNLTLTDLFDRVFPPEVRRRVYDQLLFEEQLRT
jgi:hypothetical protein